MEKFLASDFEVISRDSERAAVLNLVPTGNPYLFIVKGKVQFSDAEAHVVYAYAFGWCRQALEIATR